MISVLSLARLLLQTVPHPVTKQGSEKQRWFRPQTSLGRCSMTQENIDVYSWQEEYPVLDEMKWIDGWITTMLHKSVYNEGTGLNMQDRQLTA